MPLSPVVRSVMRHGAFALVVGALAVVPFVSLEAQKGKVDHPAANLTFAEDGDQRVRSDGQGTYVSGQSGVTATVFMDPKAVTPSGDLVVQFGSTRHANVTLQDPMALTGTSPVPGPQGTYAADTLFVQAIGFVAVGSTETRVARLANLSGLASHAVGFRADTNTETFVNGTPVCVTRHSSSGWTIFTTATGDCDGDTQSDGAGDVGALFSETSRKGKTVHTFVARYVLPFSVYVELQ